MEIDGFFDIPSNESQWTISAMDMDLALLPFKIKKIDVDGIMTGSIHVNGKKMIEYFKKQNLQIAIFRPLTVVKREKEFDVNCSVKGGGLSGQA